MPDVVDINCDPDLTDAEGNPVPVDDPRRVTERAFTPAEKAQRIKDEKEAGARRLADEKKASDREAAISAVKGSKNPEVQALLKILDLD